MNKQKQMVKKLTVVALGALVVLGATGGLFYLTGAMADDMAKKQEDAKNALQSTVTETATLRTQLEKSGEAEKNFSTLLLVRTNTDFTANDDALKDMLRRAKTQYRLSNGFKLSITPEVPTDKSDLANLNFNITARPHMKMEFDAISDLHVFSFIDDLGRQAPGIIRLDSVNIQRKSDMDAASLIDMQRGGTPYLVGAVIEFTWVGIAEKAAAPPTQPLPVAGH